MVEIRANLQRQGRYGVERAEAFARQFQAEIPIVLRWLAEHGYPGMAAIRVRSSIPIKSFFGISETRGA